MVVILNAVFDVYADENAPWDVKVFRDGHFLEALRKNVSKVRSIVSSSLSLFKQTET